MNSNYIHLHNHSCFSLLEASCNVKQIVEKAVSLGHKAVALTDTNSCAGIYEFNAECVKNGIKPILGVEIDITNDMKGDNKIDVNKRIILLAKNKEGWKNICLLVSKSYTDVDGNNPVIDYRLLEQHKDGLILLSGGFDSHLSNLIMYKKLKVAEQLVKFYKKLFGDDFYIELNRHPSKDGSLNDKIEESIIEQSIILSKKIGIKCVCANDNKYCNKSGKEMDALESMLCLKQHKIMKDDVRKKMSSLEYYMKDRSELEEIFPNMPEIFDVTMEIYDKIEENILQFGIDLLPKITPPDNMSSVDYLKKIIFEGLKKKNLHKNQDYIDRINYEIKVFEACGFVNYFLVLHDFVNWARKESIAIGPGRGSAAGSLSLYCMGVTKIDSLKYKLLFERFFAVDTKYSINGDSFGIDCSKNKIIEGLGSNFKIQHKLHVICSKHPDYDKSIFISEGKKMKQLNCLDGFLSLFINFYKYKPNQGKINICNSYLAYYANITCKKPDTEFMPKEELVAARVSPPDVDLDFDYHRRDEVFQYLREKYGQNHVSQIGTSTYFMGKSVIKDVGKVLDIGNDWEKQKLIKEETREKRLRGEKVVVEKSRETLNLVDDLASLAEAGLPFGEAYEASPQLQECLPVESDYYNICSQLDGQVRHHGIHAAGVVICNKPIAEVIPLRMAKGVACTQFDKDQVEDVGLYKYDLLALMNVSIISDTVKMIKKTRGEIVDIDEIEPDDPAVFQMLNRGHTSGIFQFESKAATDLISLIQIDEFKDMVACNAINRPGPLKAGVGDSYERRKHGKEVIDYPHPSMKKVLEDTYGLIVYQEQIMNLSKEMASFTKSEADKLRKAIGKKKKDMMEQMKAKFIDGCEMNKISKAIAVEVWQMIEYFGEYGFNLSHSLAYSVLSYQTAYLKKYYPLEFFCSLLSSCSGDKDKTLIYQREAKNFNVKFWPVNINRSKENYFIEQGGLRLPFIVVDGVGEGAVKSIIENQPYSNFEDFVKNTDHRVNITAIRNLGITTAITEGAFKPFGLSGEEAEKKYMLIKNDLKKRRIDSGKFTNSNLFANVTFVRDKSGV